MLTLFLTGLIMTINSCSKDVQKETESLQTTQNDTTTVAQNNDGTDNNGSGSSSESSSSNGAKLQTTTFNLDGISFKMILVEHGTFTMGSDNSGQSNEKPAHKVTLTKDYLIGETEVTEALWNKVMGKSGGRSNYPIASITRPQCETFVQKLTEQARKAGIIGDSVRFAMPTEAQWEFAARGGNYSKGYKYCGSDNLDEVAWTSGNHSSSAANAVAQKKPNELGLYDMSGNVYEWVYDYPGSYPSGDVTDPCNSTPSSTYIKRGGSIYYNDSYRFTPHYRYFYGGTDWTIGFRLALVQE